MTAVAPPAPPSAIGLVLKAKRLEIDAARQLAGRIECVDAIRQCIHALQHERGATSIFLASDGQRFADVRRHAQDQSGQADQRLRALFAAQADAPHGNTPSMLSLMAWTLIGLDALGDLRRRVALRQTGAQEAVAAFSRLIAGMVELISHEADAALLPSASRLLVSLLHLVQAKEAAGQERAVGAQLFASGMSDAQQQERIVHLIEAQERSLKVFADFSDSALRARWEQLQLAPGSARLERLRRALFTARAGTPIDSALSDDWFAVASERIAELGDYEAALVAQLRQDCAAHIAHADQALQDSEGLLQGLRDNVPSHMHAVERFFSAGQSGGSAPTLHMASGSGAGDAAAPLLELLQAQSAQLARAETDLQAARRALNERRVIERAKGALMSRLGMSEEAAFRALQKTSMDQNRRLLDVAEATLSLPDFAFAQLAAAPPAAPGND
jgi:hypothetical protein